MSDLMLLEVLRMPPELWTGEAIDVTQRHARYIDAADRIEAQQSKIATLTEQVRAQEDRLSDLDTKLNQAIDFLDDNGRAYLLAEWATPPKEAE